MKKEINTLKKQIDEIIRNYEEVPYGCGCNLGAEARRRARIEKLRRAMEIMEKSTIEENSEAGESENGRKAG